MQDAREIQARRLAHMKRLAFGLLVVAACVYALATVMESRHMAWGFVAAFAEAAMVGAMADWFAVTALFRHPLGLPIPHTAIIPANKDRIGANLAGFICNNFLSTPQVLAKLEKYDPASRLAHWLAQPANAERLGGFGVAAARYALSAFDDARVRAFLGEAAAAGIAKIDFSRLAGQALDALTEGGRHQALLDDVLRQVAGVVEGEAVQEHITEAIAREIKALRYVGLDQVAARMATRKIVAAVANTIGDLATQPDHPLRHRFDTFTREFIERLQHDPDFQARGEKIRAEVLAHPSLGSYLHGLWDELLAWLHADLGRPDSAIGLRIAEMAAALGQRLQADERMRQWINEQITSGAPMAIDRYREDIRRYIEERVNAWNTGEMTLELERNVGRDLQFIRINGTLVGGLVGLIIHTVTLWMRA
ncbi:DUF445 domain-containing protein [Variovorax sp. J22R133]|uniref:DUF445 domain-containing protein n=1 Tax=Variovorax brevis TaxID=3053503 RepID=UPI002574991D|nr:DUF445 domain-containing protein [Variovorax sp. J22R133]MDM0114711.1 DUF445 domain-containing protein [Variovorax sp. J22R133]